MDASLEATFEALTQTNNVSSVLITDRQGLPLVSTPDVKPAIPGLVCAIAKHAANIEPDKEEPVIMFEGETRRCLMQTVGGVTTTLFMKTPTDK